MRDYRSIYEKWLSDPYFDEETKAELRAIADDDNEIKERFDGDLGVFLQFLEEQRTKLASVAEQSQLMANPAGGGPGQDRL